MAVVTIADVLHHAERFEQMLSDFYADLAEHTSREGVRMLTDYMSRHRNRIAEALEKLSPEDAKGVCAAPLRYEPQAADCHCFDSIDLPPDATSASVLDAAIRVKEDTGITVGSLIQYPVCFLRDVEKYADFVGRGCPAGKKMVCINADGETHACFHEHESYGNVLEIGLGGVWKNMEMWRDNTLIPESCRDCKWFRWCQAGCRVFADTLDGKDYMCKGSEGLPDPVEDYEKSIHLVDDATFQVREGLRYREEDGFWLVHIVGAWITKVSPQVALFLIDHEKQGADFTAADFPADKKSLAALLTKHIVGKINE